jgi:hypothetical protein
MPAIKCRHIGGINRMQQVTGGEYAVDTRAQRRIDDRTSVRVVEFKATHSG